jgi:hypothetical protein
MYTITTPVSVSNAHKASVTLANFFVQTVHKLEGKASDHT